MKVYNQKKTKELKDYDLELGYLVPDTLTIKHREVKEVKEEGHFKVLAEFPNGGKEVEWVVDKLGTPYQPPREEIVNIYIYVPYTQEELTERANSIRIGEICERLNELSQDFTQAYLGAEIEDIDARKEEFRRLHNELRALQGKSERNYNV